MKIYSYAAVLAFCLSVACPAQVKTTVTPPGFATVEGLSTCVFFGTYSSARYQFVETGLTGKGAKMVKQVGYRRDAAVRWSDPARSWARVTLDCSETKLSNLSTVFSLNAISTPVRVFDAKVAWPKTTPLLKSPALFSTTYAFPFKKNWSYTGRNDAMLDYQFSGGTFRGSWPIPYFFLDAADNGSQIVVRRATEHGFGAGSACSDSANAWRATCNSEVVIYPKIGHGGLNNTLTFTIRSSYTAIDAPVVQGLDFSGRLAGLPINGITCNNLYLAASNSMILFFHRARAYGFAITVIGPVTANPAYKGLTVWTQAAWNGSKTGKPLLSQGSILTIPGQSPSGKNSTCVYQTSPKLMNKYGAISEGGGYNPIIQWTH